MNDPHVEALIYVVEHVETVKYDSATSIDFDRPAFHGKVEDERARFEMKEHYSTEGEAQAAVQPVIDQWEFKETLRIGPGQFALRFDHSEIEDRQPTPGVIAVSAHPVRFNFTVSTPTVTVSRQYPQPPSEAAMDIHDPDVQAMLHRYTGYRERREPLPSMAYFCLTMIEYRFHGNPRPNASRHFRIHLDVLNKIGHLTADKGGLDARKARKQKGVPENLTPHERAFLEQAVRKMILQAARVAASPEADIPTITMADLPPLPDK